LFYSIQIQIQFFKKIRIYIQRGAIVARYKMRLLRFALGRSLRSVVVPYPQISIRTLSTKKKKKKKGKGSDSEDEAESIAASASSFRSGEVLAISSDEESDEEISEEYKMIKDKLTVERQQEILSAYVAGDDVLPAKIPDKQVELLVKWMERLYSDHPYWKLEDTRSEEEKFEYDRLKKLYQEKMAKLNQERLELDKKRFDAAEKALAALPEELFTKATMTYHPPPLPASITIPLPPRPENWPFMPGPPKE
jgi:hypothetical protein